MSVEESKQIKVWRKERKKEKEENLLEMQRYSKRTNKRAKKEKIISWCLNALT